MNSSRHIICVSLALLADIAWGQPAAPKDYDYGTGNSPARTIAAVKSIPPRIRQPVAISLGPNRNLLVANRRSGTLSVIARKNLQTLAEHKVAERIADLCSVPQRPFWVAIDDAKNRLLQVTAEDTKFNVREITALPIGSAKIVVTRDGDTAFVSSTWGRAITRVALRSGNNKSNPLAHATAIPLDFPAHELALSKDENTLFVADAFGGKLAVINLGNNKIDHVHQLEAHHIRGMAVSSDGDKLLVSMQQLSRIGRTDFDDIHWGTFITNGLLTLKVEALHTASPMTGSWLERIGRTGRGSGDPGAVFTDHHDRVAVLLSGTGELVVTGSSFGQRFRVGRRPVALLVVRDDLFVANMFDDSITRVDLKLGRLGETISLGPRPKLTSVDRGEELFFDARVSHDGWMSCSSCHVDGHSSGLLTDTLGDGDFGAPKRIPSLLGTAGTGPWAWNGSIDSLQQQVTKSARTSMLGKHFTDAHAVDVVAYLKQLAPAPRATGNDRSVESGKRLFERLACARCHRPSSNFTMKNTADVGLSDELGRKLFNPPSLRGVGQRRSFFHDGRAKSLGDVIDSKHQLKRRLSSKERADLIAFLMSL